MAHCLVTGGAGFLGAHLTRALLERGHQVTVLDDLSGGRRANVDDRALFRVCDVTDADALDAVFREARFEVVYHLAAFAAEGLSHFIKRHIHTNIVLGSVNLINLAVRHECQCFVFTSSVAVYGSQPRAVGEAATPKPEDSYGIAKRAVELELEATRRMFGLDYVIFRPHNVYGELQNIGDRYRNVVGIFMNQVMNDEPLSIFGDGEQTRAFSYVEDVVSPLADSPWTRGARGEIFNVGADEPCSLNDLAARVLEAMGRPNHPIVHHPPRSEPRHALCDHSKLERIFGPRPRTPLRVGLARMAAWAWARGPQAAPPFATIEIEENLPPIWLDQTRTRT